MAMRHKHSVSILGIKMVSEIGIYIAGSFIGPFIGAAVPFCIKCIYSICINSDVVDCIFLKGRPEKFWQGQ